MTKILMVMLATVIVSTAAAYAQTATQEVAMPTQTQVQEYTGIPKPALVTEKPSGGFKASGYIQLQNQWGEPEASLKAGAPNEDPASAFNRFGVRCGMLKLSYEKGIASVVSQIDLTEKGVALKEAYLTLKDPWVGAFAFKGGVFDRPFGYEISYSSSMRESPERSMVFQTLFPEERDLGTMLTMQASASSPWSFLKLEAGLFAGNGIKQETDNRRDFIGHLSARKQWRRFSLGGGVSYYNGGVWQGSRNVYSMEGGEFVLDDNEANAGGFAKREYFGFDAELSFTSQLGETKLHGEYLSGRQPGQLNNTKSPNSSSLSTADTYLRDFSGGYAVLVQYLGGAPVALAGKYDWYDPNTAISGDGVGAGGTTSADLRRHTFGFGALWNLTSAVRLTAWYDMVRNEGIDIDDNVFTLRLQYKF